MSWYKIDLSNIQVGQGHLLRIMEKVVVLFENSNTEGATIFSSPLQPKGRSLFFTPQAYEICKTIIIEYDWSECDIPPKQWDKNDWTSRTTFFAGDKLSYDLLVGDITEPPYLKSH